jgi:hypothetical protein
MARAPVVAGPRRGRPLKFGRPARLVTVTLPEDVLAWLASLNPDPGWAIVNLYEGARHRRQAARERPLAELVQLPGRRALILVRPEIFRGIPAISLIPLQDGRAFLALEPGRGIADLEIAVLDRLEHAKTPRHEREHLSSVRALIKRWRQEGLRFETRSIIVAERKPADGRSPRPLSDLKNSRLKNVVS